MGGQYTDGRFGTRQIASVVITPSTTAADGVVGSVKFFTSVLVREVRAIPIIAGTAATTSNLDIYKGTASIGAVVYGKLAAGTSVDASLTDTTFAATDVMWFKNHTSDATASMNVLVDYNEQYVYTE